MMSTRSTAHREAHRRADKFLLKLCVAVIAAIAVYALWGVSSAQAQTLCPDGTYVMGDCSIAPNGSYVGGNPTMAPDGTWLGDGASQADTYNQTQYINTFGRTERQLRQLEPLQPLSGRSLRYGQKDNSQGMYAGPSVWWFGDP